VNIVQRRVLLQACSSTVVTALTPIVVLSSLSVGAR
jgi:hypothetical protein